MFGVEYSKEVPPLIREMGHPFPNLKSNHNKITHQVVRLHEDYKLEFQRGNVGLLELNGMRVCHLSNGEMCPHYIFTKPLL